MSDEVTEATRERLVATLRQHAVEGTMTLEEFGARVGEVYAATTAGDLAAVSSSLPAVVVHAPRRRRKATRFILSLMGSSDRKGRWRVGERLTVIAVMGGNDIDLRHAELDSTDITIDAFSIMGGIEIYVPDSVEVDLGGFALMGSNDHRGSLRAPAAGAPEIRIRAWAIMGGVDVWRVPSGVAGSLADARSTAKELERGGGADR
jgi:hypothetical protein